MFQPSETSGNKKGLCNPRCAARGVLRIKYFLVPILTGNPGGNLRMRKSWRRAKWVLVRDMSSMMGATCSTRDSGYSSLIHRVPLNLRNSTTNNHSVLEPG